MEHNLSSLGLSPFGKSLAFIQTAVLNQTENFWAEELIYLNRSFYDLFFVFQGHVSRAERHRWSVCHQSFKERCHCSRWWCGMYHDRKEGAGLTWQTTISHFSFLLLPVICELFSSNITWNTFFATVLFKGESDRCSPLIKYSLVSGICDKLNNILTISRSH